MCRHKKAFEFFRFWNWVNSKVPFSYGSSLIMFKLCVASWKGRRNIGVPCWSGQSKIEMNSCTSCPHSTRRPWATRYADKPRYVISVVLPGAFIMTAKQSPAVVQDSHSHVLCSVLVLLLYQKPRNFLVPPTVCEVSFSLSK